MIKLPQTSAVIVTAKGIMTSNFATWLNDFAKYVGHKPFCLKSYTVSNAPDPANYEGHIVYISDETSGATVAFSDGTNWRRVQDRAIIS